MASIGELFQSDRVNHDEVMKKLEALGGGADINQIIEDEKRAKDAQLAESLTGGVIESLPPLPDAFPDDLFENPASNPDYAPKLLEGPEEQELLEAFNSVPRLEDPAYGEISQTVEAGHDRYGIPLETVKSERTHGVAAEASALHVETEDTPEDLAKAHISELNGLVFDIIRQNNLLVAGSVYSDEQKRAYNETDEKMTELFKVCEKEGLSPDVLENFAVMLDHSLFQEKRNEGDSAAPVEFTTPGSAEPTEMRTASVDLGESTALAEKQGLPESKADEDKYALNTRVTAVHAGIVKAGWRVASIRQDETGRTLYDLHHNFTGDDLEGLTEQTLDVYQGLEPTPAEDNPTLKEELKSTIAEKIEAVTPAAIELREAAADKLIEAGQKARELWSGGLRDRLKKAFEVPEMAKRWASDKLIDPYKGLKAKGAAEVTVGATKFIEARVEAYKLRQAGKEMDWQKNLLKKVGRNSLTIGTLAYASYRLVMTAQGMHGSSGTVEHVLQNGAGLGTGTGHESLDLSQLNGDQGVQITEVDPSASPSASESLAPTPHVSHGAESIPAHEVAPSPHAPEHAASPVGNALDIKPVLHDEGGIHWFDRNGLSPKEWYNHENDMLKRFPKYLYKTPGGDIRLNHAGAVSKEFQKYLENLKKGN